MTYRSFGSTGLRVSPLGVGLAEMGYGLRLDQSGQASWILNRALDRGVNLIDTAACYGIGEELVGFSIAHRRSEYVLSTKCGHVAAGYQGEPWTAATITDSIDRSLRRMKTDHIDILHLHGCPITVIERGEALEAMRRARDQGKVRFIGYSGDNEAAAFAVESGHFEVLQTSFNLVDQRARTLLLPEATARGMGVIAKRPIANAVWGADSTPGPYADSYFARAMAMLADGPLAAGNGHGDFFAAGAADGSRASIVTALGYTLSFRGVGTAIVGTADSDHMTENIRLLEAALRLSPQIVGELNRRFDRIGAEWEQLS